jgi:hypothetical protein
MLQPALARFYDASRSLHLPAGLPALSLHGGGADMQVGWTLGLGRLAGWLAG